MIIIMRREKMAEIYGLLPLKMHLHMINYFFLFLKLLNYLMPERDFHQSTSINVNNFVLNLYRLFPEIQ